MKRRTFLGTLLAALTVPLAAALPKGKKRTNYTATDVIEARRAGLRRCKPIPMDGVEAYAQAYRKAMNEMYDEMILRAVKR